MENLLLSGMLLEPALCADQIDVSKLERLKKIKENVLNKSINHLELCENLNPLHERLRNSTNISIAKLNKSLLIEETK